MLMFLKILTSQGGALRNIQKIDAGRLATIRQEWEQEAGEDEFAVALSHVFEWAEGHLEAVENESQALELFNTESQGADVIVEVINSKRGSLAKLLKIHYGPHLWNAGESRERLEELVDVTSDAMIEVLSEYLTQSMIREVKVYGRTSVMLQMLEMIHNDWNQEGTWSTRMEGRWIAFNRTSSKGAE